MRETQKPISSKSDYVHETTVQSCRGEDNHPPDVTANQIVATMRKQARKESTSCNLADYLSADIHQTGL